ncbi:putative oxygenase MesX, partial [Xanthomonas phaseoli]
IGTIATMETFQKIYRPEIYNANAAAGPTYRPSLKHQDYSSTQIVYDRQERSQLAVTQGRFTEEHFIRPYGSLLAQWASSHASYSTRTHDIPHHDQAAPHLNRR